MLVLSAADVRALVPMAEAIRLMGVAFAELSAGRAQARPAAFLGGGSVAPCAAGAPGDAVPMRRGRSPLTLLLVVLVVAVAGAGGYWLLRDGGRPEEGPTPLSGPEGELPRMGPAMGAPQAPRMEAPPREAVASADERRIPTPEDWPGMLRIKVENVPESLEVTGEKLRDALLATPSLHLRWSSESVRDAFLKATIRLSPEVNMPRDAPRGAPITTVMGSIVQAGFSADLDPPVLKISEGKPLPSPVQPPR